MKLRRDWRALRDLRDIRKYVAGIAIDRIVRRVRGRAGGILGEHPFGAGGHDPGGMS